MLDKGHASRKKNYVKFNYLNIFVYTVSCICKLFELLSTLRLLEKIVYFWSEHSIPLKELSTIIKYLNYKNPCSSVTSLRKFNNLTDIQQYSQKAWTKEFHMLKTEDNTRRFYSIKKINQIYPIISNLSQSTATLKKYSINQN